MKNLIFPEHTYIDAFVPPTTSHFVAWHLDFLVCLHMLSFWKQSSSHYQTLSYESYAALLSLSRFTPLIGVNRILVSLIEILLLLLAQLYAHITFFFSPLYMHDAWIFKLFNSSWTCVNPTYIFYICIDLESNPRSNS